MTVAQLVPIGNMISITLIGPATQEHKKLWAMLILDKPKQSLKIYLKVHMFLLQVLFIRIKMSTIMGLMIYVAKKVSK